MKKQITLLFFLGFSTLLFSQTPKLICDITNSPIHGENVVTVGTVTSVPSDDDFYITQGGCNIKCDGDEGNMPSVGQFIVVYGEVENDGELELDVSFWGIPSSPPVGPPNPDPTVTTVAQALSAAPGTVAELTGNVTTYTDPGDGEGIFTDGADNIKVDFEGNDKPATGVQIVILGTIEFDDGMKEIDVYHWYPDGGSPPPNPPSIAWTANDASTAPIGTYAVIPGNVSSWTNMGDGEGIFDDDTGSVNVDFEDGLTLPQLLELITIFGHIEMDDGQNEVQAILWEMGQLGISEISSSSSIILYPIPTVDQLFIKADLIIDSLQIFDVTGKNDLFFKFSIH